jgi:hypothetical protein
LSNRWENGGANTLMRQEILLWMWRCERTNAKTKRKAAMKTFVGIKKRTWKVHCIAMCTVCGKEWSNYKNAQGCAAIHARSTGHKVTGEVGLAFEYGG